MILTNQIRSLVVGLFWLLLLLAPRVGRAQHAYTEYELKAGYLVSFPKFIQWPKANNPFVIGVLGVSPFGPMLEEVVKQNVPKGTVWSTRHFASVQKMEECHVLFIARDQSKNVDAILQALAGKPVLCIADGIGGFCKAGGMINLLEGKQAKPFEINLRALRQAGLQFNPELMRLAVQVE